MEQRPQRRHLVVKARDCREDCDLGHICQRRIGFWPEMQGRKAGAGGATESLHRVVKKDDSILLQLPQSAIVNAILLKELSRAL